MALHNSPCFEQVKGMTKNESIVHNVRLCGMWGELKARPLYFFHIKTVNDWWKSNILDSKLALGILTKQVA